MARAKKERHQGEDVSFNLTPMIDVTFQLIIFFMLAGSLASLDNIRLEVPKLHKSVAEETDAPNRVVVNVPPYPKTEIEADDRLKGAARMYVIRTRQIETGNVGELTTVLSEQRNVFERRKSENPALKDLSFQVEIRADTSIEWSQVWPVLAAARSAGIEKMVFAAQVPLAGE